MRNKYNGFAHVDILVCCDDSDSFSRLNRCDIIAREDLHVLIGTEISKIENDSILRESRNMVEGIFWIVGVVCHGEGHQEGRCPILISWPLHDRRALDVELAAQHISPIVITGNRLLFSRPGRRRRTRRRIQSGLEPVNFSVYGG